MSKCTWNFREWFRLSFHALVIVHEALGREDTPLPPPGSAYNPANVNLHTAGFPPWNLDAQEGSPGHC